MKDTSPDEKRAEATSNDADAVLHEAVKLQDHLLAQDAVLRSLLQAASGAD